MKIKLHGITSNQNYVVVDGCDFDEVTKYKWYLNKGYASTTFHTLGCSRKDKHRNTNILLHRFIMGSPPHLFVDHINRDTLDNRRANLRVVTPQQSTWNTSGSGVSGYKGVYPEGRKWGAVCAGLYLGVYLTVEEAAQARDKVARVKYEEYAYLNFPEVYYTMPVRGLDFAVKPRVRQSKYQGVSYIVSGGKRKKRWRATFRKKQLGLYMTEHEAGNAYNEAKNGHQNTKRKKG